MTTLQQIQREIKILPEYARKEVFDFVLFLKEKEQKAHAKELNPSVASSNPTKKEQDDWIKTLPEMTLSQKEQQSLADSRKTQGEEMTIDEFQASLKHANV